MGDPDTYRRLRELFDAVVEQPPAARDAWIGRHVDAADREPLRRLLAADATSGHLETPAGEIAARIGGDASAWSSALVGQQVGGFRLVHLLGQGGMGAVFLGERIGADFEQRVAVKLLRRGLFSDIEHALFRRERRVLAMLSHPNITHLVDGGVTDAGIPYLVMEHVDGVPITTHARDRRLAVRDRLALFLTVCRAAAAAHRQLVVHRDIKPSNILVTADGVPKLLDFGIAKLLDDDAGDATRTGFAVLTREYAAPEQLAGGPVGTATDVYSLGVLLHELLTEARPESPTQRASSRAAPAIAGALRGDLDNILLKALDPEPGRRYGSAAELADDIARHLAAQPVSAHPPSAWYRTRKFVRRHRGGVALTLVFLVAIVASLGIAAWQANEARVQARIAREQAAAALAQAQRADETRAFLEQLFQPFADGTSADRAPSLRELLAGGVARIAQRYPEQPAVRADLLAMFARINDAMGETQSNRQLAADAWRANVEAYGDGDARTLAARLLHANLLRKLGEHDAAIAELQALRAALGSGPRRLQAEALDALSLARRQRGGDPSESVAMEREALALRLADADATANDRATGYNNLASAQQAAGDFAAAAVGYERAYALRRPAGDSVDTASVLFNLGSVLSQTGRWREAEVRFAEARAMFARIPIEKHPALVNVLLRQCGVLIDLERVAEAGDACRDAEAMTIAVHGERHAQYFAWLLRAANLHVLRGERAAADAAFARARTLARGTPAIGDERVLLGVADAWQARAWWLGDETAPLRDAMLALLDAPPPLGPKTSGAFQFASFAALGCVLQASAACGAEQRERAEALLAEPVAAHSALRLPARLALAEAAIAAGKPVPAIAPIEALLRELDSELPPAHSWRAQALLTLAALRAAAGDAAGARRDAGRGRAALAALPPGHPLHRHRWLLARVPAG